MSAPDNNSSSNSNSRLSGQEPLLESDYAATHMTFGDGKTPSVIYFVWACYAVSWVLFTMTYVFPDYATW